MKLPSDAFTVCTPAPLDDVDGLDELLADELLADELLADDDDAPELALVDDA